ncbi:MAG: hypothetical protein ACE5Z5_08220 [Candidatus Bathyarchaeia archaeon]
MTSITLPLKKFPGQTRQVPTFFGGRALFAPTVLLLTTPFTLYTYYLSCCSLLSYNILGLLPYLWGGVSIAGCIRKSSYAFEELFEADLNQAQQIFDETRNYFRGVLISNIFFSIILITVFSYSLIVYREVSLFTIGLSSIMSMEIALASILSQSNVKGILTYICIVCASESLFLLIAFRGLWMFNLILLACGLLGLFLCLNLVERYDLRSFFERVIN